VHAAIVKESENALPELVSTPRLSSILHVTDLHVGSKYKFDQTVLIDAMTSDLTKMSTGPFKPEYLCFSGDLAFSGSSETYSDVLEILLKIATAAGIKENRIIMAPGNHDASTSIVNQKSRELDGLRKRLALKENGDSLISTQEWSSYFTSVFSPYYSLCQAFESSQKVDESPFLEIHNFEHISYISLNTSLLTGTGLPGLKDEGQLYFPEDKLYGAIKSVPSGNTIIFMGHHPLSWLMPKNRTRITSLIEKYGAAYLFGHVHEAKPSKQVLTNGTLFTLQGGALYQGRDNNAWSGYCLALHCAAQNAWMLKTRKWYEQRRTYDAAVELGTEGEFSTDQGYWRKVLPSIDSGGLAAWQQETFIPMLRATIGETVLGADIETVFVPPEFSFEKQIINQTEHSFGSRFGTVSYADLLSSDASFLISSAPETGKTTTLCHLALDLANKQIVDVNWKIPVKIDFSAFSPNQNGLKKLIKRTLGTLPAHQTFEELLKSGRLVIMIDDFDFRDQARKTVISEFVTEYTACRFLLTTSTPIYDSAGMQPEIAEGHVFRTVSYKPLRASGLRALIESSKPNKSISSDILRERILKEAELLNVPLTAVTSTFLIQILSSETAERPMNQAALVERYLDLLLEKYSKPELELGTFNYKNKTDLLSAIAEHMVRNSISFVSEVEIVNFIEDYLKKFGLAYSALSIFSHLKDTRVLQVKSGSVCFRLRMFFEYYVAHRMSTEPEFCNYVFEPGRYVTYPNEIALYCALNLKDEKRLDEVYSGYTSAFQKVWGTKSANDRGGVALDKFALPSGDRGIEYIEEFALIDKDHADLEEERTQTLESIELPDQTSQEISRFAPQDEISDWLAHMLLLGGMLKHLELIPNETKLRILDSLIDGWLHFTQFSLGIVVEISKRRRLTINNVTYKSALPEDMAEVDVARLLASFMPIAVSKMASLTLGTEKLSQQLKAGIGSKTEPASKSLFRFSLLVDLVLNDVISSGTDVLNRVAGSAFLSRAFAFKLRDLAIRYKMTDEQLDECRRLTAEAALSVQKGSKGDKVAQRNKIIEGIKRERLLLSFRSQAD
jgi:hypothetical protein